MNTRHRLRNLLAASMLLALAGSACMTEPTATSRESDTPVNGLSQDAGPRQTGRHIINLREGTSASTDLLGLLAQYGAVVERYHREIGVLSVSGLTDAQAAEVSGITNVEDIARDVSLAWIPPGDEEGLQVMGSPAAAGTDQSGAGFYAAGYQWNITQVQADAAWGPTHGGAGAVVAILDSGLDPFHQDLAGKIDLVNSVSMLTPGSSPCNAQLGLPDEETFYDFRYHGSFVGGIVTTNGIGVASVAPDASLLAVKVLNCNGSGSFDDVIAGILYAADQGVDVINMSLGALIPNTLTYWSLIRAQQRAVSYALRRNVLVVAAAGNDGLDMDDYRDLIQVPAMLRGVLSVGATGPIGQMDFDQLAGYSNYGFRGLDMVAPGGNNVGVDERDGIVSVCSSTSVFFGCGSGTFYLIGGNGTSFASPHVAGAAAVVESSFSANLPGRSLFKCVTKDADHIDGHWVSPVYGVGRLNVLNAATEPNGAFCDG